MRNLPTYDLLDAGRITAEWMGASARAFWTNPMWGLVPSPVPRLMAAWGEVTERAFQRMVAKPDWGVETVLVGERERVVRIERVIERPFGDLIHFVADRPTPPRRVLLVAPMSGHYPTLIRKTVHSLLPECDVFVTEWHNARDIPVSEGKFDIEDYTLYLADFIRHLGPQTNVISICQPVPLTLAAVAHLAAHEPEAQPRTLTLIGGPVDPDANPTEVTDFGRRVTMGQLERLVIQRVGVNWPGVGRLVYPGVLQLAGFISMNLDEHATAFTNQIFRIAQGVAEEHDKHNQFYDEYLAVMDMTAEFYLSTVERIFKRREIARNAFTLRGELVDLGRIDRTAVKIVEGEEDDISAPGQCRAALDLLTGIPPTMKAAHVEPGAGHYGIFAGRKWRENIRPLVIDFIDRHADGPIAAEGNVTAIA